jgi:hypothetical protein
LQQKDAGEVLTGTNVVRDKVMGGNQGAYDIVQTVFAMAGAGIIAIGQTRPGICNPALNVTELTTNNFT